MRLSGRILSHKASPGILICGPSFKPGVPAILGGGRRKAEKFFKFFFGVVREFSSSCRFRYEGQENTSYRSGKTEGV
jgi:hypothetical protein